MSVLHVGDWTSEEVADWIAGLDDALTRYGEVFVNKGVNGKRLLNLMAGDLPTYGVDKVGDQILLAEALQYLRNELESDRVTLQTLASNVAVRSKTYRSELSSTRVKANYISNDSLASASYLLEAGKALVQWLTRFPFVGVEEYDEITKLLLKHLSELAMHSQRDKFADSPMQEVQYLCTKIIELCDDIIASKDSLTMQPAAVDVVTIRKRHEQELGLQLERNFSGMHMITGVNLSSPAHQSGHLERGDEILQVNYQTVVGWTPESVINMLYEKPFEVILTLKRRPRHASNSLGHMYLRPSKLPSRSARSKLVPAAHFPILETVGDETEELTPVLEQSAPIETPVIDIEPHVANNAAAEARFRKLYPKPRNILRRRATVTGASPTSTRPPVTFTSEESMDAQPSGSGGIGVRHKLDKCVSAPERNKLEKQGQVDEALRLFVGDLNIRGSRVTLPCVGVQGPTLPDLVNPKSQETTGSPSNLEVQQKNVGEKSEDESSDDVFETSEPTTVIDTVVKRKPKNEPKEEKALELPTKKPEPIKVIVEKNNGPDPVPPPRPTAPKPGVVKAVVREPPVAKPRTMSPPKTLNTKIYPSHLENKYSSSSLNAAGCGSREELRRILPTKPQSLTNLTTAGGGDGTYSGFLHQRQPHWKMGGPRWARCRATVEGTYFRLLKPELLIRVDAANVTLANEVHSRPFAFKIEDKYDKSLVHYFAAESQSQLAIWLEHLGASDQLARARGIGMLNRSMSVQPEPRCLSSPIQGERHRRLSLPQTEHNLRNQLRRRLNKQHSTSGGLQSSSTNTVEDRLRFWNSSPSPTHKSNISSITITTSKRSQQNELAKKKYFEQSGSRLMHRQASCDNHVLTHRNDFIGSEENLRHATPVRKPPDSPSKKYKMGASMLLRRKGSDCTAGSHETCTTCGRNFASSDKSTQTDELVLVFSDPRGQNESRI